MQSLSSLVNVKKAQDDEEDGEGGKTTCVTITC